MAYQRAGHAIDQSHIWRGSPDRLTLTVLTQYLNLGVTAFLAENDEFGEVILMQMEALGLRCPEDFSLAVLGDSMRAATPPREWASFKIPREAMGREAVRLLLTMLEAEGGSPEQYQLTLPCAFIPGATVAKRKDS